MCRERAVSHSAHTPRRIPLISSRSASLRPFPSCRCHPSIPRNTRKCSPKSIRDYRSRSRSSPKPTPSQVPFQMGRNTSLYARPKPNNNTRLFRCRHIEPSNCRSCRTALLSNTRLEKIMRSTCAGLGRNLSLASTPPDTATHQPKPICRV